MNPLKSKYFPKLLEKNDSELFYMVDNPRGIRREAVKVAAYILEKRRQSKDYSNLEYSELLHEKNVINDKMYPVESNLLKRELLLREPKRAQFKIGNFIQEETIEKIYPNVSSSPRLGIKFRLQGEAIDQFTEITEQEFSSFLFSPMPFQEMIVEDSSIRLFVKFDAKKTEYGFKFRYLDKYSQDEYKSVVHGFSNDFTFRFLRDFIDKGRIELDLINWKKFKYSFLKLIAKAISISFAILFSLLIVLMNFEINFFGSHLRDDIMRLVFEKRLIFWLLLPMLFITAIKDRHQLLNFRKLSSSEKMDTLSPYFVVPIILLILLFEKLT